LLLLNQVISTGQEIQAIQGKSLQRNLHDVQV